MEEIRLFGTFAAFLGQRLRNRHGKERKKSSTAWNTNMNTKLALGLLAAVSALSPMIEQTTAAPLARRGSRLVELAQADAPAAPGAPAAGNPEAQLRAVVVAVKNNVQIRQNEEGAWAPAKAGDVLGSGAEIRTGLNSAVQLKIEPGHTVTIDRFSVVKLLNLAKDKGVIKTDVGMKYGRTRYDVEAAGETHDAKIHTPGTTLAIRGTQTGTQTDAFTESTWVIKGAVDNTNKLRREMVRMDSSTGKAVVTSDLVTPSAFAKNKAKNDGKGEFAGRNNSEKEVVEQYASGELDDRQGGVEEGQKWARREGFGFAAVGVFGDVFDLDIAWAPDLIEADVDLIVHDPLCGTLDFKGTQITVRDGQDTQGTFTTGDDAGLGFGFEAVQYGPSVPSGSYLVTVRHTSGDDATGQISGSLGSVGLFGQENFSVGAGNPEAQFIVNPQAQTITPIINQNN